MAQRRHVRAPGRVNLIGEHTDYSGGYALPAAIDRGVDVHFEPGGDVVELTSTGFDGTFRCAADGSDAVGDRGWGRYVAAVAHELAVLGRPPVGLRGTINSDLPTGVGLSSSAALEVAVGLTLCVAADHRVDGLELARACQRAEHRAVGVPSGLLDQMAALFARAGSAMLLEFTGLSMRHTPLPDDVALLIIDSGVTRQLEESGYGQRRQELERALTAIGGRPPHEVDPAELDELTAQMDDVPARRLRHVVTENRRVTDTVAALSAPGGADLEAVARLFAASHASMRDDYEITLPEIDLLVELTLEAGAVAARMTGGGFGGAIVALAIERDAAAIANDVATAFRERTGHEPAVVQTRPSDGALRLLEEAG